MIKYFMLFASLWYSIDLYNIIVDKPVHKSSMFTMAVLTILMFLSNFMKLLAEELLNKKINTISQDNSLTDKQKSDKIATLNKLIGGKK